GFGVFVAGYAAILAQGFTATSSFLGCVLAVGALAITHSFRKLDRRNAELVECDEAPIKKLEARIAAVIGVDEFKTVEESEKTRGGDKIRYGTVMPRLFCFASVLSWALLMWSVASLFWSWDVRALEVV